MAWLQAQGARQIYFKYCSNFGSTVQGNIGPLIDALMDALRTDFTIATPAFSDNNRIVFKGYLFVGDTLLVDAISNDDVMRLDSGVAIGLRQNFDIASSAQRPHQQRMQTRPETARRIQAKRAISGTLG